MSTSACGEGGPNGAVGGLDDTSAPGAGECGAGKAHCKRHRRLAANGDFTGLAFVAAVESCMSVEGRSAATPAASTATWDVVESSKPNSSLAVTAVDCTPPTTTDCSSTTSPSEYQAPSASSTSTHSLIEDPGPKSLRIKFHSLFLQFLHVQDQHFLQPEQA